MWRVVSENDSWERKADVMAGNYDGLARMLVLNIGGKSNVTSVSHCGTRLHFVLKDEGQANTELIQSLDGVVTVLRENGEYQIVVGNHAPEVYESVLRTGKMEELGVSFADGQPAPAESRRSRYAWLIGLLVFAIIETAGITLLGIPLNVGTFVAMVLGAVCGSVICEAWDRHRKKVKSAAANRQSDTDADQAPAIRSEVLGAPVQGRIISLADLSDEAFASGVLGKGLGFEPEDGRLYAPCDGEITTFFPTGHAIGIHSDGGADILIHVGLGTVKLNGQGFAPKKQQGDRTKKGELLLEFEPGTIREAGMSIETPMIISNSEMYADIVLTKKASAKQGDMVIETKV